MRLFLFLLLVTALFYVGLYSGALHVWMHYPATRSLAMPVALIWITGAGTCLALEWPVAYVDMGTRIAVSFVTSACAAVVLIVAYADLLRLDHMVQP